MVEVAVLILEVELLGLELFAGLGAGLATAAGLGAGSKLMNGARKTAGGVGGHLMVLYAV